MFLQSLGWFILFSPLMSLAHDHDHDFHEDETHGWKKKIDYVSHIPDRKLIANMPDLKKLINSGNGDAGTYSEQNFGELLQKEMTAEGRKMFLDRKKTCLDKLGQNLGPDPRAKLSEIFQYGLETLEKMMTNQKPDPNEYFKIFREKFDAFHKSMNIREEIWLKKNCEFIQYLMRANRATLSEAFRRIDQDSRNRL